MRALLYQLKREYGVGPLSIYSHIETTVDLTTGEKSIDKTVTVLQRVVSLPAKVSRDVIQTISMISANKEFVYGGTYDSRTRDILIDRYDAPTLELGKDDWFVLDGHKYEIKSIQEFETRTGWLVVARQTDDALPEQIHVLHADHLLDLQQNKVRLQVLDDLLTLDSEAQNG
jgi:hypothetical protein